MMNKKLYNESKILYNSIDKDVVSCKKEIAKLKKNRRLMYEERSLLFLKKDRLCSKLNESDKILKRVLKIKSDFHDFFKFTSLLLLMLVFIDKITGTLFGDMNTYLVMLVPTNFVVTGLLSKIVTEYIVRKKTNYQSLKLLCDDREFLIHEQINLDMLINDKNIELRDNQTGIYTIDSCVSVMNEQKAKLSTLMNEISSCHMTSVSKVFDGYAPKILDGHSPKKKIYLKN